jgi:hypothetical protein
VLNGASEKILLSSLNGLQSIDFVLNTLRIVGVIKAQANRAVTEWAHCVNPDRGIASKFRGMREFIANNLYSIPLAGNQGETWFVMRGHWKANETTGGAKMQ